MVPHAVSSSDDSKGLDRRAQLEIRWHSQEAWTRGMVCCALAETRSSGIADIKLVHASRDTSRSPTIRLKTSGGLSAEHIRPERAITRIFPSDTALRPPPNTSHDLLTPWNRVDEALSDPRVSAHVRAVDIQIHTVEDVFSEAEREDGLLGMLRTGRLLRFTEAITRRNDVH